MYKIPTIRCSFLWFRYCLSRISRWVTHSRGGFPGSSNGKEFACNARDLGSIPGSGRSPGEENGNPLQCSCLENPMDRGAGRLQSMGSQRVGHNWATNIHTFIAEQKNCVPPGKVWESRRKPGGGTTENGSYVRFLVMQAKDEEQKKREHQRQILPY